MLGAAVPLESVIIMELKDVASVVTALVAVSGLLMAIFQKPLKKIRDDIQGLGDDLGKIKDHLRDHDEVLRNLQSGQRTIITALSTVVEPDVGAMSSELTKGHNVVPFKIPKGRSG